MLYVPRNVGASRARVIRYTFVPGTIGLLIGGAAGYYTRMTVCRILPTLPFRHPPAFRIGAPSCSSARLAR
jgi:hypothetical protein